jgi:cobaltochelatase CobN
MIRAQFLFRCLTLLVLTLFALTAVAAEIVGVISPRNAADVLSGAHQFLESNPSHSIKLRTTDQFNGLSEADRKALLEGADIVFLGGVFGDSVSLFSSYLDPNTGIDIKSFVAVHSDRRLVSESRILNTSMLLNADVDELMKDPPAAEGTDVMQWSNSRLEQFSDHKDWLLSKTFWADRDVDNIDGLFRHLAFLSGIPMTVPNPKLQSPLRVFLGGNIASPDSITLSKAHRWVAIVDYETGARPGERDLIEQICTQLEANENTKCLTVLAKWGESSVRAARLLAEHKGQISLVVSLQNFVLGGGEGRAQVNEYLAELDVPVIKGLRLSDSTADEYRLSEEGLRWDSVHYRVAMPELQGISQPLVLAAMTEASLDPQTGVRLSLSQPIAKQVALLVHRAQRWLVLQTKANKDKRVAIIYYNHPPGRHNIGADNLNVPESLLEILHHLKSIGYNTGVLPE